MCFKPSSQLIDREQILCQKKYASDELDNNVIAMMEKTTVDTGSTIILVVVLLAS